MKRKFAAPANPESAVMRSLKRPLSPYFDVKRDAEGEKYMEVRLDGFALLRHALTNKGTAFTRKERIALPSVQKWKQRRITTSGYNAGHARSVQHPQRRFCLPLCPGNRGVRRKSPHSAPFPRGGRGRGRSCRRNGPDVRGSAPVWRR